MHCRCGIRGAARAVLSCAGAYVPVAAGSNECPAGYFRIETEAACRTAAFSVGRAFRGTVTNSSYPRGCFYFTDAFFNAHAVGAGDRVANLLCAAATAGALPPIR